jgi:hypothetical protein
VGLVTLLAACLVVPSVRAAFTSSKTTQQTLASVADFLPPTISVAQVSGPGGEAGVVQAGASYRVCAQVGDQGNPPSGIATVRSDVGSIAGVATTATLTAQACTIGSGSYNYGSGTLTAGSRLAAGASVPYSVTAADALGQSATQSYSVNVATPPSSCHGTAITATNGGAAVQQVDSGDAILFGFSAAIDQTSIISDWTGNGSPGPVRIKVADNGSADSITVEYNGSLLPLGTIATKTNFVNSGTAVFGGTLIMSGNNVRLTVDYLTSEGPGIPVKGSASAMTWTPGAGLRDTSGGPCSTAPVTQPSSTANF